MPSNPGNSALGSSLQLLHQTHMVGHKVAEILECAMAWLQNVGSADLAVSEKALYAVSALIRNSHDGQHRFYQEQGPKALVRLLEGDPSRRQLRKIVDLVKDLADAEAFVEVALTYSLSGFVASKSRCQWQRYIIFVEHFTKERR